jgi:hypothetical protein
MPKYTVSYEATFTVEAESADAAVDLIPTDITNQIEGEIEFVRVDGHDWDLDMPPSCSLQTFPGSRIDPPEFCDEPVVRWDEDTDSWWCAKHASQPDDGPFGEDD